MSPVTMSPMGRKKHQAEPGPAPEPQTQPPKTGVIRIALDLSKKLSLIANVDEADIKDIVDPILRPAIERLYAAAVAKLSKNVVEGGR